MHLRIAYKFTLVDIRNASANLVHAWLRFWTK